MNCQDIKDNAPDGATHYFGSMGYISYWKLDGGFKRWCEHFNIWVDRGNPMFSRIVTMDKLKPL